MQVFSVVPHYNVCQLIMSVVSSALVQTNEILLPGPAGDLVLGGVAVPLLLPGICLGFWRAVVGILWS